MARLSTACGCLFFFLSQLLCACAPPFHSQFFPYHSPMSSPQMIRKLGFLAILLELRCVSKREIEESKSER